MGHTAHAQCYIKMVFGNLFALCLKVLSKCIWAEKASILMF